MFDTLQAMGYGITNSKLLALKQKLTVNNFVSSKCDKNTKKIGMLVLKLSKCFVFIITFQSQ